MEQQFRFNFPMQLVTDGQLAEAANTEADDPSAPAMLSIIQARPSQSRRGGYKIVLGFPVPGTDSAAPLVPLRLEMN